MHKCQTCGGTGEDNAGDPNKCADCHGTGDRDNHHDDQKCPVCWPDREERKAIDRADYELDFGAPLMRASRANRSTIG